MEQPEAILHALAELPDGLDPELVALAEQHLLELAGDHDAQALRMLGRRLLEVVSPETADAHEAQLLEREERAAAAATRFTMWEDGHGKVHGRFILDTLIGAALKKAVFAIAAPKHQASQGPLGDRRPTPERLGQAFTEYVQRYPTTKLPKAGGLNATVVVSMTLETLWAGSRPPTSTPAKPSPPTPPAGLPAKPGSSPPSSGGKSQVLDQGRKRRFHTEARTGPCRNRRRTHALQVPSLRRSRQARPAEPESWS